MSDSQLNILNGITLDKINAEQHIFLSVIWQKAESGYMIEILLLTLQILSNTDQTLWNVGMRELKMRLLKPVLDTTL